MLECVKKQKIGTRIVIALILMLFILGGVFFIHKSRSMSQTQIQELMQKSTNYDNYSMIIIKTENDVKTEKEIKTRGNIVIKKKKDVRVWTNYETGEQITISYQDKTATLEKVEPKEYHFFNPSKYEEYQYKYLYEKVQDGKRYAYIAYKSDQYYVEAILDQELGIDIQEEIYELDGKMRKGDLNTIYEIKDFKLGVITEEEMEKPDITDYKIIDKRK